MYIHAYIYIAMIMIVVIIGTVINIWIMEIGDYDNSCC